MLTLDQQLQAKEEGWKIVGGYVANAHSTARLTLFDSFVRKARPPTGIVTST